MLANSEIFDNTGRVRLSSSNRNLLLKWNSYHAEPLHAIEAKINEDNDAELMETLRLFCEVHKLSFAMAKTMERCVRVARLRLCYIKERDAMQTSWNTDLQIPNKMVQKMEKQLTTMLKSKNCSILQEKLKLRAKMEKDLKDLTSAVEDCNRQIEAKENELKHHRLSSFLQECYGSMDKHIAHASLYMALSNKDKEHVKKLKSHHQRENALFETIEYLHGVKYQKHKLEARVKVVMEQLRVNKNSIDALQGDIEEEADKSTAEQDVAAAVVVPSLQENVPDNWDDDL